MTRKNGLSKKNRFPLVVKRQKQFVYELLVPAPDSTQNWRWLQIRESGASESGAVWHQVDCARPRRKFLTGSR